MLQRANSEGRVPAAVNWAANALLTYGALAVANAILVNGHSDWLLPGDYTGALLRGGGMVLLWWGLRRRISIAWWVAVCLPALWALSSIAMTVTVWRVARPFAADGPSLTLSGAHVVAVGLLLAAVALLGIPAGRHAFRRGAQPN